MIYASTTCIYMYVESADVKIVLGTLNGSARLNAA